MFVSVVTVDADNLMTDLACEWLVNCENIKYKMIPFTVTETYRGYSQY